MMNGMSTIPYDRFFKLDDSRRIRGHSLKLVKRRFTTTIRQHFFSERVVNRWNSLDEDTVTAPSLTASRIDLGS